jgi:hypothetical protein
MNKRNCHLSLSTPTLPPQPPSEKSGIECQRKQLKRKTHHLSKETRIWFQTRNTHTHALKELVSWRTLKLFPRMRYSEAISSRAVAHIVADVVDARTFAMTGMSSIYWYNATFEDNLSKINHAHIASGNSPDDNKRPYHTSLNTSWKASYNIYKFTLKQAHQQSTRSSHRCKNWKSVR